MVDRTADPRFAGAGPPRRAWRPGWSDPRTRNLVYQALAVAIVVSVLWYLVGNTARNLAARHIATGFAFLHRVAGIPIAEQPIPYDPATSTFARALTEGVLNTLKVSVAGIVLATVIGTFIGIGRLSRNWLLARLAAVYVEVLRDVPLLLQLLFWYTLLSALPGPRQAIHPLPGVFLSNRGIKVPALSWQPADGWVLLALALGIVATLLWRRHAARRQAATGRRPPVWPVGMALIVALPAIVWAALGAPFALDIPALRGFNFRGGGTITPEYAALTIGLVVYTASYIAEIVRSGIQAVPQGQWEAAAALGLHRGFVLRRVVLPQALRVIVPPMTSQYLNLIKNSSLAIAIGYQDIVSITGTALNQTGQSIECIALVMVVYLCFSLSISLFMNWYNAHIALVER